MNESLLNAIPPFLLGLRLICHMLIFLRVATYMRESDEPHRRVVGLCAALFAGFNLAESIRILSNFYSYSAFVQPYLTGIMLLVLLFVVWSGGNVAKLMPRRIIDKLP